MDITREDLIQAIASDLEGRTGTDAAITAIGAIEALGFVIVPRVPDSMMYLHAGMSMGEARKADPSLRLGDLYKAQWDGAIAGSPLYREVKG